MSHRPLTIELPPLPPEFAAAEAAALERARAANWAPRLAVADPTLFTLDPAVVAAVERRTGWLRLARTMRPVAGAMREMATTLHAEGIREALVMGMGGSSIAPEVIASILGHHDDAIGVTVIDSTDPAAVLRAFVALDPRTTLLVVGTKSGTTTETLAFLAAARAWAAAAGMDEAAIDRHTVTIADPGAPTAAIPGSATMRATIEHPADVGGRYSALTPVGLLPTALLGHDPAQLLDGGALILDDLEGEGATAIALGLRLGVLAGLRVDKLTLLADPRLAPLGAWVEQLIAESTGKMGIGIVPIDREPVGAPASYGAGRVILRLRDANAPDAGLDALAATIGAHGLPQAMMTISPDAIGLGAAFAAFEVATAIAGVVLNINPFDEPNVAESKANTGAVLEHVAAHGTLPEVPVAATFERLRLSGDAHAPHPHVEEEAIEFVRAFIARIPTDGYLALCAYLAADPETDAKIAALRDVLRDRRIVTTAGYGPRFLHSTGQLHKGGPKGGAFLVLRATREPLPIPGRPYGFETLIDAQARGDVRAIEGRGRPVIEVDLGGDPVAGLSLLRRLIVAALA